MRYLSQSDRLKQLPFFLMPEAAHLSLSKAKDHTWVEGGGGGGI